MAEEKEKTTERIFEQPADAISFYCENAVILRTPNELFLQLYETIPGTPAVAGGLPKHVTCRLRATITLSYQHAKNIGTSLTLLGDNK